MNRILNYAKLFACQDLTMEFNDETAKLTINDAYVEDTGDYSCEIWNEVGQQDCSFKILVKEKKGKPKRSRVPTPKTSVPSINVTNEEQAKAAAAEPSSSNRFNDSF